MFPKSILLLVGVIIILIPLSNTQNIYDDTKTQQIGSKLRENQRKNNSNQQSSEQCKDDHDQVLEMSFEQTTKKIEDLFNQDRTYEAFTLLDELQKANQQNKVIYEEETDICNQQRMKNFLQTEMVKILLKNKETFEMRFPQLNDMSGWSKYIDEPNRKLYYKKEQGYNIVTQYMEAVFDAPYMDILLMLREVDLMEEWIPLAKEVRVLNPFTPWRQTMTQKFKAPWPMKNRECLIEVTGFLVPFDNSIVFTFESVEQDAESWFGSKIKRDKKNYIELLLNRSFGYLKPLGPNQTQFKFIVNADPQLDYIPNGLIDWGIKTVSGGFITYLGNQCANLPKMYVKRLKEKREEYDRLRNFVEETLNIPYEDTKNVL